MDPSFLSAQIEGIEWIVLLIIIAALFFFGPTKLPEMARGFGRALGEFQKGRLAVEKEIRDEFKGVHEETQKIDATMKAELEKLKP